MFKTLRFSLLSMLVMLCGTVMADDAYYTLDTTGSVQTTNNAYANVGTVTVEGVEWAFEGNGKINPWRLGGKSIADQDRAVYTKTAMDAAISSINLTVGTASDITVNSLKLIVANDADFSDVIDEVSKEFAASSAITFTPTSATSWDADVYYKFVFNVTVSTNSNKFVQLSKVEFFKATGGETPVVTVAKPVITPNGGTFFEAQDVTISCETEGATIYYTTDGTTPSEASTRYTPFRVNETTTVKAIAIKDGASSAVATATFTISQTSSYSTIAELTALENNTAFTFTGEARIIAKPTAKFVYINDNSGNTLIYDSTGEKTAAAEVGKMIAANWTGKVNIYRKLFELVPDKAIVVKDEPAQPITYPEGTFSEAAVNSVITLKNVTSYTVDGKNISVYINGEDKEMQEAYGAKGYNQFGLEIAAAEEGKTYEIVGAIGKYNDQLQFWPIEIKEQGVEPQPEPTLDFYVAGSMNDWKVDAAYKMTQNSKAAEGIKEYFFTTTLEAGAEFKVVSSYDGSKIESWFPEGNNYVVETAGEYTIYFRPNRDGGDDWYSKYIYVASNETPEPQPIETVGEGTLENPYTAADAIKVAGALEQGSTSEDDYYVKGKISSIKYEFNASFGTATFSISDDGEAANEFLCYSVYYLENKSWQEGDTQIKVGDEVILFGKLTNYNGTPETASKKAYIYSLTSAQPVVVAKYYIVGNMTEWAVNADYEMTRNEATEAEEYLFTTNLTTTNQFKVVKVEGEAQTWYPNGTGNNYGENGEITTDGEYIIYFRPNADGGDDWFNGCIYVEAKAAPADVTTVTFDFNASDHDVSATGSTDGDITENEVLTVDGVTMTISPAEEGTANRYWGTKNGPQLRMYSGTMTITAPDGKAITKATFNNGKWNTGNTFNGVAAETGEWEGNSTSLILTVAGNTQINSVVLTISDANEQTTTGIVAVKADNHMEGIFNLNGQKVMKAQKGLYIINGKKVVLK